MVKFKFMKIADISMVTRLKEYKDLFLIFMWRELIIRYKQTALGVFWALLQPLSMMLLFVLVFGLILNIKTNGYPKALFYFSGLIPWTFFLPLSQLRSIPLSPTET
jgi:lipopolysaccharide transport system permease protein